MGDAEEPQLPPPHPDPLRPFGAERENKAGEGRAGFYRRISEAQIKPTTKATAKLVKGFCSA